MAEGGKNTQECGGWWSSWMNSAKEQTEKAFEMVSQDLAEFTTTMQSDTKKVVEKTKETMQTNEGAEKTGTDRMKQSFYSLMEGITKVLTVEPEDTSPPRSSAPQPASAIFDRAKARLRAIQVDTGTYLAEPTGAPELYADWLKSFDIEANKGDISDLLVSMVEVRSLYTSLVPSEVSHQNFWRRYFYKVHQLQVDEARKQALMKRAERANVKEDSISWDEEEWENGDEDSSPGKSFGDQREDPASRLKPDNSTDASCKDSNHDKKEGPDSIEKEKASKTFEDSNKAPVEEKKVVTRLKDSEANSDHSVDQGQKDESVNVQVETTSNDSKKHIENEDVGTSEGKTDDKSDEENIVFKNVTPGFDSRKRKESITEKSEVDNNSEPVKVVECDTESKTELDTKNTVSKTGTDAGSKIETVVDGTNLKTKLKGDMVVVGDRISPSSESSGNKESSTDDWEHDFDDVDVTAEDLEAAQELANKLNMSPAEFNTLTGGEDDDWENWD